MGVEQGVGQRSHGEGAREGVLGHHEHAQDGVDDSEHDDQRVEAVPHLLPVQGVDGKSNII